LGFAVIWWRFDGGLKINGRIPAKVGNTHISLTLRGVFPLIASKIFEFCLI